MEPQPRPELVAELAEAVRAQAPGGGAVSAEWSQVATSHAGRIYLNGERFPLPQTATGIFRRLHEQMRDDAHGAWFSARIDVPAGGAGEARFTANYRDRVYWNSESMLTPPASASPIPSDGEWSAELRRHPRAAEHVPEWIHTRPVNTSEFANLRAALDKIGLPRGSARLPGEEHPTFEGALLVRRLDAAYSVDIFDYGQLHHIGSEATDRAAGLLAWNYLTSPLPPPVAVLAADLLARAQAARSGYADLAARITAAGPGGVVTNLPTGVPFDRWGGVDGLYLYAWRTPLAERSLPPSATGEGAIPVGFVANRPVPVQAEFTPAWFDQPGGGIRFRTREPLRDLVRAGSLSVITTDPASGADSGDEHGG